MPWILAVLISGVVNLAVLGTLLGLLLILYLTLLDAVHPAIRNRKKTLSKGHS